ncbi:MAG: transposase [Acidobacteria bacterium]|nr:transposase [Acidobacteriota bacterium]
MKQSIQAGFDFGNGFGKKLTVDFAGPTVTSDGGLLLLKQTETKLNLLCRLAFCFRDVRDPTRVQHSVAERLSQRVFGLALGDEDLNDHDRLRHDPSLGAIAGRTDQGASLAS